MTIFDFIKWEIDLILRRFMIKLVIDIEFEMEDNTPIPLDLTLKELTTRYANDFKKLYCI